MLVAGAVTVGGLEAMPLAKALVVAVAVARLLNGDEDGGVTSSPSMALAMVAVASTVRAAGVLFWAMWLQWTLGHRLAALPTLYIDLCFHFDFVKT